MHRLLASQIAKASLPDGSVDGERLLQLVAQSYEHFDKDRARSDRATRLMIEEVEAAKAAEDTARAERARQEAEAAELRQRQLSAEAASRAKSSFLAVMSHEIRTPMNAVLGLSSVLLGARLSEEDREIVRAIHTSGENLLQLLNDILDYSKLEAGHIELELRPFSPLAILEDAISIMRPRAVAKGLTIETNVAADVPEALVGDAGRLRQVILNLLSNAVKFTEAGSVTLGMRCCAAANGHATIECVVRDTGIGIAADRLGALFSDFVQADCTINRRFGGSGLGLSICKKIIEQMGGKIGIESTLGQGTRTAFTVMLAVGEKPSVVDPVTDDASGQLETYIARLRRPLRLLVVDDNKTNRLVASKMLGSFDVAIDTAGDGCEAIAAAQKSAYDAILMDMRMPEMDGMEATRIIRSRPGSNQYTPIIAFTANAFPEDEEACRSAGMNGFVAKPIRRTQMLNVLLRLLEQPGVASRPSDQTCSDSDRISATIAKAA